MQGTRCRCPSWRHGLRQPDTIGEVRWRVPVSSACAAEFWTYIHLRQRPQPVWSFGAMRWTLFRILM
ncbi:hypothetical protein EVA_11966 [gut metagenome]|uniref:Uncharacterized protein n=1 Tax=gut metagenome TaxID=749906 RepID=J9FY62_9ZZZZ